MSKTLDYKEACKLHLEGKQIQWHHEDLGWRDYIATDICFWQDNTYRLKPIHKTLWVAHWSTGSATACYSESNPWASGTVVPVWVENLPHRYIEV